MRRTVRSQCFAIAVGAVAIAGAVLAARAAHAVGPVQQVGHAVRIAEPTREITTWTYDPRLVTVTAGEAVRWANLGAVPHTVTSRDGLFDSSLMNVGDVFVWTPPAPGTYEYLCIYHPWMTGTVVAQ